MKIIFVLTADIDSGEFTVTCPNIFEAKDNGWGPEISTNYRAEYKDDIYKSISKPIRTRFMQLAKLTKAEIERAEHYEELKK